MKIADLKKLAERTRFMREAGNALLFASIFLALFLFIPLAPQGDATPPVTTTTTAPIPDAFANMQIEAKAVIVYDLLREESLYEKNADAQLPLASLTKILTVYGALAELSPQTPISISA